MSAKRALSTQLWLNCATLHNTIFYRPIYVIKSLRDLKDILIKMCISIGKYFLIFYYNMIMNNAISYCLSLRTRHGWFLSWFSVFGSNKQGGIGKFNRKPGLITGSGSFGTDVEDVPFPFSFFSVKRHGGSGKSSLYSSFIPWFSLWWGPSFFTVANIWSHKSHLVQTMPFSIDFVSSCSNDF